MGVPADSAMSQAERGPKHWWEAGQRKEIAIAIVGTATGGHRSKATRKNTFVNFGGPVDLAGSLAGGRRLEDCRSRVCRRGPIQPDSALYP